MNQLPSMERVWHPPHNGTSAQPPLVLYNSLVDRKVPFIPSAGPESKSISWYACGPTGKCQATRRAGRRTWCPALPAGGAATLPVNMLRLLPLLC